MARQAQQVFHAAKEFIGEGHFGRAVHLRLDDVDGAAPRVATDLQVMQGGEGGDYAVEDAFGYFVAFAIEDGRVGHQVADIAHEHQRATRQAQARAIGGGVAAVGVQAPGERLAALADFLGEVALHQAQPVAVDLHLVCRIHGGNRILAIHDGAEGGLQQHILDPGGIGLADRVTGVDLDFEVQPMVLQQDGAGCVGRTLIADETRGIAQSALAIPQADEQLTAVHPIAAGVGMGAFGQRRGLVEEGAGKSDHSLAANRVVAGTFLRTAVLGDGIGAVECIVERAPACVGGVQRIARVGHGYDQLWTGLYGQFRVDVGGRGLHLRWLLQQIADLAEEGSIGCHITDRAWVGSVPVVQFALQAVTFGQEGAVLWRQVMHQGIEVPPEGLLVQAGARQRFVVDKGGQLGSHLQAVALHVFGHAVSPLKVRPGTGRRRRRSGHPGRP
ncbi:hypothetical protein D9M68_599430 [compost metagenome]